MEKPVLLWVLDELKLPQSINMEEVVARFTLGSLNKLKKHLVPLPWQRQYEIDKSNFHQ